ncbi:MAG: DUF4280 domain-containing protein [Chloroflexota bacterium]
MPELVVNGAQMTCTFGVMPSTLTVLPAGPILQAGGQLLARIVDSAPMMNIAPFGMCTTPSNPQVAAATSAAAGVLTPQPCLPVITAPWTPGSAKVSAGGIPALTSTSTCTCAWGGSISIISAGQVKVTG